MRDRTRELRQDCGRSSGEEEEEERERVALVGVQPPAPRPPGADTLLQARGVRAALGALEQKLEALERQQEAALGTPLPDEGLKQGLQRLREEIQELTRDIRARLRALEPGQEQAAGGDVGARVRRTQHGVLSQRFLALTGRCHAAQARYRQRSLERVRRQLLVAGRGPVPEEELERMLESGEGEVFVCHVLGATRATRAALEEVGVRQRELQRLESGLRELGELWAVLGGALEGQGELIDRIERNIQESGTRLRKGGQQLGAAQRSQRGARQKKLVAAACVVVALAVVVAVLAGTLGAG